MPKDRQPFHEEFLHTWMAGLAPFFTDSLRPAGETSSTAYGWWREFAKYLVPGAFNAHAQRPPGADFLQFSRLLGDYAEQYRKSMRDTDAVAQGLRLMVAELRATVEVLLEQLEMQERNALPDLLQSWQKMLWGLRAEAKTAPSAAAAAWTAEPLDYLFVGPALGLTREWELRLRELYRKLIAQRKASRALSRQLLLVMKDALERFSTEAAREDQDAAEITTVQQLYDLWVDCAEAAYKEIVMTDTYTQVFGNYLNAALAIRKDGLALLDQVLGALELPNRSELNGLLAKLEAPRQIAAAADQQQPRDDARLSARIHALEAEIARLGAEMQDGRHKRTAAPTKSAARKPPVNGSVKKPVRKKKATSGGQRLEFDIAAITAERQR